MRLKDWLLKNNMSEADFAKKIGTTYMAVHRYINDGRVPKKKVMDGIG